VLKLIGKVQVDGKTIKQYDQASTPFRRVLAADQVSAAVKLSLTNQFVYLNPAQLRIQIDRKLAQLWKIVR
jgi:hypothetical protein